LEDGRFWLLGRLNDDADLLGKKAPEIRLLLETMRVFVNEAEPNHLPDTSVKGQPGTASIHRDFRLYTLRKSTGGSQRSFM
jgi:hypothetical protein